MKNLALMHISDRLDELKKKIGGKRRAKSSFFFEETVKIAIIGVFQHQKDPFVVVEVAKQPKNVRMPEKRA